LPWFASTNRRNPASSNSGAAAGAARRRLRGFLPMDDKKCKKMERLVEKPIKFLKFSRIAPESAGPAARGLFPGL
jgi:hypothetical protein